MAKKKTRKPVKKSPKKAPQTMIEEFKTRLEQPILSLVDEVDDLRQRAVARGEQIRQEVLESEPVGRAEEALDRAQETFSEATDKALDAVGLMRKSAHEEELKKIKKRHKALRKAAVTKALKQVAAQA